MINHFDYLFTELIKIKNWRVSIQADGMELIAVFNDYLAKIIEGLILFFLIILLTSFLN